MAAASPAVLSRMYSTVSALGDRAWWWTFMTEALKPERMETGSSGSINFRYANEEEIDLLKGVLSSFPLLTLADEPESMRSGRGDSPGTAERTPPSPLCASCTTRNGEPQILSSPNLPQLWIELLTIQGVLDQLRCIFDRLVYIGIDC